MMLSVTRRIGFILQNSFRGKLDKGAFPKVQWVSSVDGLFSSWNHMEYRLHWLTYSRIVHGKIRQQGEPLGIYSRKYSDAFLRNILDICDAITEQEVYDYGVKLYSNFPLE